MQCTVAAFNKKNDVVNECCQTGVGGLVTGKIE
jgi:hypothetical protein